MLLLPATMLVGQRVTFHLSKTIDVPQDVLIQSTGPSSVHVTGRGMINTRHLRDKYVVSGKDVSPHIYVIHKTMDINSWEKAQVKQVVEVTVETATPEQAAALQEALRPVLKVASGNIVSLNCELNIARFSVYNGWFRQDANSITLTDGQVFPVKYLEINNRFFLPELAPLDLTLNRTNLSLGDHQGSIELQQAFGRVSGGCLRDMTAALNDTYVRIDKLDEANLQLTNCELKLGQVNKITMETSLSEVEVDSIGQLRIKTSVSDRFNLGQVSEGNAAEVIFTTFKIDRLLHRWQLAGKGTTLSVREAHRALKSFRADNQDGNVQFPLNDLSSYKLWCGAPEKNNYELPDLLQKGPGRKVDEFYERGTAKPPCLIRLTGQRSVFRLRPT